MVSMTSAAPSSSRAAPEPAIAVTSGPVKASGGWDNGGVTGGGVIEVASTPWVGVGVGDDGGAAGSLILSSTHGASVGSNGLSTPFTTLSPCAATLFQVYCPLVSALPAASSVGTFMAQL